MANWDVKPLSEVCKIKPPKSEARAKLAEDEEVSFVPMEDLGIGVKHLQAKNTRLFGEVSGSYTYFADGDVLLAKITPCFENGKLGIARGLTNGVGFGSSEFIVFRPMPELDAEFLYYYLARPAFRDEGARTMTGAVGHKRVAKEFIDSYPIPLPPLPEQRRLVAILSEAFNAIAIAKANAEKNLQSVQELAEALSGTCFIQNSDDRFIPQELTNLCELIVDCEHKTAPTQEHGFPSIRTPNIGKGHLLLENVNRVSEETYATWTRRAVPLPGDLILAREAPAGNVAVIPDGMRVCLGQRTVLIRPRREALEPMYLAHLLLQRDSQQRLLAHSRGATVQHINLKDIRAFVIGSVPNLDTQRRVVDRLAEIEQMRETLSSVQRQKIVALDELAACLLHQAFAGQLAPAKIPIVAQLPVLHASTPRFTANVIAIAYVRHAKQQREKTFGRVKEQKVLHLVESIAKVDLGRQPMKDAAGPNDFQHMLKAEQWAKENGFFEMIDRGQGYDFRPLKDFEKHLLTARQELAPHLNRIEEVIDLLVPMDSQEAEVFATVHAAWNNLLMDGVEATEGAILKEARDTWHPDKLSIPEHKFKKAIELVRRKNLIPDGTGKYVTGQRALL